MALKANIDKALAVAALLLLTGVSLFLMRQVQSTREEAAMNAVFAGNGSGRAAAAVVDSARWQDEQMRVQNPYTVDAASNRLFVSELRVWCVNESCQRPIPYGTKKCPYCEQEQPDEDTSLVDNDGDGIPDKREQEFGLNPFDPDDAMADPDGDGYSNLEEFDALSKQWLTNPADATLYPPPAAKIRLYKYKVTPFKIQFKGVTDLDDGYRFQLNLGGQSEFARLGEDLVVKQKNKPDEVYHLESYEEKIRRVDGHRVDESELILRKSNGDAIKLIKNKSITQEDKMGILVYIINRKVFKVHVNEQFSLIGFDYNVLDISQERVLLEEVNTGKEVYVPKLTAEELNELRKSSARSKAAR